MTMNLVADRSTFIDRPFGCPPDIVLDLPAPVSVNRTRKFDWTSSKLVRKWKSAADKYVLQAKCRSLNPLKLQKIPRFELRIVLSEQHTGVDLDNGIKSLIDYLHSIELIENDSPKHMRKLTVEWGMAPEGARVTVVRLA